MKYKVLQVCTRRSEDRKVYNAGELIELNEEDAAELIKQGIVEAVNQVVEAPKKKSK